MKCQRNRRQNFSKTYAALSFVNAQNIYVSKHAIERYMLRYKKSDANIAKRKLLEIFNKSILVNINKDGTERRFSPQENMFLICADSKRNGIQTKTIVTVTMGYMSQLRFFSKNVMDIDYVAMDNAYAMRK